MSAVAWTHWHEAFEAAEREPEKRLTFTLAPAVYERALVSMASEHGWLERKDPRYQKACRDGHLEWWDGRGRCVVVVREGARIGGMDATLREALAQAAVTRGAPLGRPYTEPIPEPDPLVPDPVVTGGFLPKSVAEAIAPPALTADRPKALDGVTDAEVREIMGPALTPTFARGKGRRK